MSPSTPPPSTPSSSSSSSSDSTLKSGDLVAGRYVIHRLRLDEGAAQWWSARDRDLEREVLLKVLCCGPGDVDGRDEAMRDAFVAEGRNASHLRHRDAIRVHDTVSGHAGEAATNASLIIMELPAGSELSSGRSAPGPMPWEDAAPLLQSLADVIAEAHAEGVVHGGLRPELIWVQPAAAGRSDVALTVAGFGSRLRPGTERHLAPELRAPENTDSSNTKETAGPGVLTNPTVAADVYGVAAIAYQLLSGGRPDGTRLHHRANVPWPLADAVMAGLADQPEDRPPSVQAFLATLQESASPTAGRGARTDATPTLKPPRRVNRIVVALAGLGVVLAALWFVTTQIDRGTATPTAASPTSPPAVPGLAAATTEIAEAPAAPTAAAEPTLAPTATPMPTLTPAPTPTSIPVLPLIVAATPFDPPPGSGGEQNAAAPNIFDGVVGTEWSTEVYGSFDFGGLKSGVGISVTLDRSVVLNNLRLTSSTPQWRAQVYLADARADTLEGWGASVADLEMTPDQAGQLDAALPPTEAGAVLIWVTELGNYGGGFGVAIDEIAFNVTTP